MHIGSHIAMLGTESAFEVLARAQALAARGRSVINLGIGQPDFPTPPHIVEAACRALRDGHHGYTPANGIPALREAIAAGATERTGAHVDPGQVVVVPGGKVTMSFAMLIFGRPGAEILYPDPGFPIYRSMIEFSGATAVGYALPARNGFSLCADEVLARITPRTRLLILNSPANPTGGVMSGGERDRLVAGLARHPDVFILSDEIYGRLVFGAARHHSLLAAASLRDRLIVLDGVSKTYAMTGWRLGWGIWPGALAEIATRLAINIHSCVNAATQQAAVAALTGPEDAVEHMVATFAARRDVLVDALNRLPGVHCAQPGGGLLRLPEHRGLRLLRARAAGPVARRARRGHHRRHQLRPPRRGPHPPLVCQLHRQHSRGGASPR